MNRIVTIAFAFLFLAAFAFPQMNDGVGDGQSDQGQMGASEDLLISPLSGNAGNGTDDLEEAAALVSSEVSDEDLALIEDITDLEVTDMASASELLNNSQFMNCFSSEIKSEVLALYVRYMSAQSSNDSEEISSINEEALQLRERLREELVSCGSKSGSDRPGQVQEMNQEMRQVISSYTERIQNLSSIEDVGQRNMEREQIRNETMSAVKAIVQERKQVNASDLAQITGKVQMTANRIMINGDEINGTGVSVLARIRNRTMNMSSMGSSLFMNENGLQVSIPSVEIDENGSIKVNGSAMNVLPSEAQEKVRMTIKTMEMVKESNSLMYKASGEEDRKLLGLFSVKVETKAKISAENGQVLSEERPWWSFLTTE